MTTTIKRQRTSDQGQAHEHFRNILRSEWTKFRTVRGWITGSIVAILLVVLFTYLVSKGTHQGMCTGASSSSATCVAGHPFVPTGPDGEAVADTFYFVNQTLTGDGTITARVTSLTGEISTSPGNVAPSLSQTRPGLAEWAKAGILITPNTKQGSPYAAVMATGSHGVRFQYDYTHDSAGLPGQVSATSPRWLRLTRTGDTITGYDSSDGTTWTKIDSAQFAGLPNTVHVGLFVTSPVFFEPSAGSEPTAATAVPVNRGQPSLATAGFDQVDIQPGHTSGNWQGMSIGTALPSPTQFGDFYPTLDPGSFHRSGESFVVTGSGDIAPGVVAGDGASTVSSSLLLGISTGLIAMIVVAVLNVTSEYRQGLIRTTLTATPRRNRVLAAKAVIVGSASFVVALVAISVAVPLAAHILRGNGDYVYPVTTPTEMRIIIGGAAMLALAAMTALALGTILRNSAGAVSLGIALLVLPYIFVAAVSGSSVGWMLRWSPAAALAVFEELPRSPLVSYPYTSGRGYYPLAPWAGLAVLCGYAAFTLVLATITLRRRDA